MKRSLIHLNSQLLRSMYDLRLARAQHLPMMSRFEIATQQGSRGGFIEITQRFFRVEVVIS